MYELTSEHRAALPAHHEKWRSIALSTAPMGKHEKDRLRRAVVGLYAAAKFVAPVVVFVPSPLRANIVAGIAVAAEGRKLLPRKPGESAVATTVRTALGEPRRSVSWDVPLHRDEKWHPSLFPEIELAARELGIPLGEAQHACAYAHVMRDAGNQWAGWAEFVAFFRHVVKLEIDYTHWRHYETLSEAGPRYMGPGWCVVSERPQVLLRDAEGRPHCDDGPFVRWRDGVSLYAVHGTYIPRQVIEDPGSITVHAIMGCSNAEVRRVMVERYGIGRFTQDAKLRLVDDSTDPLGAPRRLYAGGGLVVVELHNSTPDANGERRVYHVLCHPQLRPLRPDGSLGFEQELTAKNAVASTFGMTGEEYTFEGES